MATAAQVKSFISTIAPIIQKYAKLNGYKTCSAIIAQACVESQYGTSQLASKYFNFFGMKCGSSWKGKSVNLSTREEYTAGTLTNIKANFRVYDNMEEGIKGYFQFISVARYSNLIKAKTPKEYLEMIKADGYATSSTYVQTIMNVVTSQKLEVYDKEDRGPNPYTPPKRILKLTSPMMTGDDVKWLQFELGFDDKDIDGKFGNNTNKAYKQYLGF